MPSLKATFSASLPNRDKQSVALSSVLAAAALTALKLVVGVLTGSLGILSEAAHSGLDFVAALVTYIFVRWADRPADKSHPFGHGKFEHLSAFIETALLLTTCLIRSEVPSGAASTNASSVRFPNRALIKITMPATAKAAIGSALRSQPICFRWAA